jgi:hypothetical protein
MLPTQAHLAPQQHLQHRHQLVEQQQRERLAARGRQQRLHPRDNALERGGQSQHPRRAQLASTVVRLAQLEGGLKRRVWMYGVQARAAAAAGLCERFDHVC